MNPAALSALLAQHKTAALGAAAAGVAGLALMQRKKKAAAPAGATAGATVPTTIAGTIPAAAVVPAGGTTGAGGYDSSSYDTYNALQPELAAILQGQQALATGGPGGGITAAPPPVSSPLLSSTRPIAAGLFAPTNSGNFALYGDGTVAEVESDGSQLGLSQGQWNGLLSQGAKVSTTIPGSTHPGAYYETARNLAAVPKA